MKIDCRLYYRSLVTIKPQLIAKAQFVGPCRAANEFSVYNHYPMQVVVMFLMLPECLGPREDLKKMLEGLMKFGTCEEIIPFD